MFSSADLSLAAGKMRKNKLVTDGFRYDFTYSQAASYKHFQCLNRSFMIFEEGYCKDFQNYPSKGFQTGKLKLLV
jgi:hypothetical protein